ncbi:tRNA:m(4)X modification enzyme TRM13 [Entomortierella beljakovae]|nr:tRNA:m(4)X modification enzyme TRM13 [Entomortierella beljakovae]
MADAKRPFESKDPEPVAKALAGTLEPLALNHRPRNKRQKVQGPPPPVPKRPRQCHFLQLNKNKYCSLTTKLGNKFCGEHSMHEAVASPSASNSGSEGNGESSDAQTIRKRIPCPFDPSHTAWADDLKAHLYKCNARPREAPSLFSKDVNLALPSPTGSKDIKDILLESIEPTEPTSNSNPKPDVLATLSQEQLGSLINKIQDLYAKHVPEIRTVILDHSALDERKKIVKNVKHAHQQASLLGNMKRLNMLDDKSTCYIEFGSGRGELSNYLKFAVDDHGTATFILVDRTPSRNKFDNAILGLEETKSLVKRYTMDIKDLVLAEVPELRVDITATQRSLSDIKSDNNETKDGSEYIQKKPVVAISKHLCGGATDLTLRCLANYQQSIPTMDSHARERLGRQCKRLLDIGRVQYLKGIGFDAELVYYVDKETSLENLALMAVPSNSE